MYYGYIHKFFFFSESSMKTKNLESFIVIMIFAAGEERFSNIGCL
jgi:hypothetical protein